MTSNGLRGRRDPRLDSESRNRPRQETRSSSRFRPYSDRRPDKIPDFDRRSDIGWSDSSRFVEERLQTWVPQTLPEWNSEAGWGANPFPLQSEGNWHPHCDFVESRTSFAPRLSDVFTPDLHRLLYKLVCLRFACRDGERLPADFVERGSRILDSILATGRYPTDPFVEQRSPQESWNVSDTACYDPVNPRMRL